MARFSRIENRPDVGWCEVTYEELVLKPVYELTPMLVEIVKESLSAAYLHPTVVAATTPNGAQQAMMAQAVSLTNAIVMALRAKGFVKEFV